MFSEACRKRKPDSGPTSGKTAAMADTGWQRVRLKKLNPLDIQAQVETVRRFIKNGAGFSIGAMHRKELSPEFLRNPTLARNNKKGPLWRYSAYLPVFKAKKGPRKICAKSWLLVTRA